MLNNGTEEMMLQKKNLKRLLLLTLLLLLIFTLVSCSRAGSETVYGKETLRENITAEKNTSRDFAWNYFDRWNFPAFNSAKLKSVEVLFRDNYYIDLPTSYELAKTSAARFLDEYYDKTDLSNSDAVTDALIRSYVYALEDKYSVYRSADEYVQYTGNLSGNFVGVGITVQRYNDTEEFIVVAVNEDSPAKTAGILPGDIVVAVDGVEVKLLGYEAAINAIKGEAGSSVTLTVLRGSNRLNLVAVRAPIIDKTVEYSLTGNIGYIKITSFKSNTDEQFEEAVDYMLDNGAAGIIYDLRSNSGGYLDTVQHMLEYIAPKGVTLVSFSNNYSKDYVCRDTHTALLPSVVLCNGSTASAAELFTAGIRDLCKMGYLDAVIVGETTFGKGIMQRTYTLFDKSAVTMTVAYYNPPSGKNYHGVGITPDVTVALEAVGDTQLSAAEAEIQKLIKNK